MKQERFSVIKRLASFKYAFNGLKILIREEHNARIHLVAAVGALAAGIAFRISAYEWMAVIFAIGIVFAAEIFNSALEKIANLISAEQNPKIKIIKDLSAAAVLVSAVTALVIGLIIFLPKVFF